MTKKDNGSTLLADIKAKEQECHRAALRLDTVKEHVKELKAEYEQRTAELRAMIREEELPLFDANGDGEE